MMLQLQLPGPFRQCQLAWPCSACKTRPDCEYLGRQPRQHPACRCCGGCAIAHAGNDMGQPHAASTGGSEQHAPRGHALRHQHSQPAADLMRGAMGPLQQTSAARHHLAALLLPLPPLPTVCAMTPPVVQSLACHTCNHKTNTNADAVVYGTHQHTVCVCVARAMAHAGSGPCAASRRIKWRDGSRN